jgi:hypothetical protein
MADGFGESWRALLPDLQPAKRILHAAQLGCARRGGTAGERHSSPETKRHYQLGMVDEVHEGIERANEHAYQNQKLLRFYYGRVKLEKKV